VRLRSGAEGLEEAIDLVVEFGGIGKCLSNLGEQDFAETLAQAMRRNHGGTVGEPQLGCHLGVRRGCGTPCQKHLQLVEVGRFASPGRFVAKLRGNPVEQRLGPTALEDPLGGQIVCWFAKVSRLARVEVD